jgi:hypothetical protein
LLGQHTDEVYREVVGYNPDALADLHHGGVFPLSMDEAGGESKESVR